MAAERRAAAATEKRILRGDGNEVEEFSSVRKDQGACGRSDQFAAIISSWKGTYTAQKDN